MSIHICKLTGWTNDAMWRVLREQNFQFLFYHTLRSPKYQLHFLFCSPLSRKCRSPLSTLLFVEFERGNQCFCRDASGKKRKKCRKNGQRDKCKTFFAIVSCSHFLHTYMNAIWSHRDYIKKKERGKER